MMRATQITGQVRLTVGTACAQALGRIRTGRSQARPARTYSAPGGAGAARRTVTSRLTVTVHMTVTARTSVTARTTITIRLPNVGARTGVAAHGRPAGLAGRGPTARATATATRVPMVSTGHGRGHMARTTREGSGRCAGMVIARLAPPAMGPIPPCRRSQQARGPVLARPRLPRPLLPCPRPRPRTS